MTRSALHIDLTMEAPAWNEVLQDAEPVVEVAIQAAWRKAGNPNRHSEVSIVLGEDEMVRRLNAAYRGQDKPTNVLSFPADADETPDDAPCMLGDIVLAYGTVSREAGEQGKALSDHVSHLCVHGMLHLLGHDHDTDLEAEEMEALEVSILAELGIADPFSVTAPEVNG